MRNTTTSILVLAIGLALALTACSDFSEPKTPEFKTKLKSDEIKNSAFKAEFPLHYETYLRNNETEIMTEYGGSVAYNKHDNIKPLPEGYKHAQPYLKNLWLGYPFSYEPESVNLAANNSPIQFFRCFCGQRDRNWRLT